MSEPSKRYRRFRLQLCIDVPEGETLQIERLRAMAVGLSSDEWDEGDESHLADIIDCLELLLHIKRRARASRPTD